MFNSYVKLPERKAASGSKDADVIRHDIYISDISPLLIDYRRKSNVESDLQLQREHHDCPVDLGYIHFQTRTCLRPFCGIKLGCYAQEKVGIEI